jgi:opacity protein-like surface antigen
MSNFISDVAKLVRYNRFLVVETWREVDTPLANGDVRMKVAMLAGTALVVLMGANALAADVGPAPRNWTGFYFGVGGGGNYTFGDIGASGYGVMGVGGACAPFALVPNADPDGSDTEDCDYTFSDNGVDFAGYYSNRPVINNYFAGSAAIIGSGSGNVMDQIESALDESGMGGMIGQEIESILGFAADTLNGQESDSGAASWFGRGQIGFDYQVGDSFVVGLDAAYNLGESSVDQSATVFSGAAIDASDDGYSVGSGHLDASLSVDNMWTVGGRMGFLVMENTLLFVSGGYASAKAELSASFEADDGAEVSADYGSSEWYAQSSDDDWLSGYYVGGGMETLLTETISLRAEYRYADLGSIETSFEASAGGSDQNGGAFAATGVSAEANPVVHSISATLNWRF